MTITTTNANEVVAGHPGSALQQQSTEKAEAPSSDEGERGNGNDNSDVANDVEEASKRKEGKNESSNAALPMGIIDETTTSSRLPNNDGHETVNASPQRLFDTREAKSMEHLYYEYEDADSNALASGMMRQDSRHYAGGLPAKKKMSKRRSVTATAAPFDISYHPGRIMAYSPPCQRQKWGDTQVLPRVNWGDLFFDLHYVAATYNVSNILVLDPSFTGLLYAAGTFLPIMGIWVHNTAFSARFSVDDDLYHRVIQVVTLVVLATSVLHIRPVEIMKYSSTHISMFVFALCLCLERLIGILNYLEVYCYGVGQRQVLKRVAIREMGLSVASLCFYGAATILAATEFFPRSSEDTAASHRRLAGASDEYGETYDSGSGKTSSVYESSNSESSSSTNVPILLCLGAFCFHISFVAFTVVCLFPKDGSHKKRMVPLNIDFLIHRYGEWTHLMLGESVFSILIVDVADESREYFGTFYASVLTVIMLQYLHFKSEPHSAHGHASRRDKGAGIGWNFLVHVYSFALTSLGAAYTFFLRDFDYDSQRRQRYLAGSEEEYDRNSMRERAAHLFCGSLAVIFFSLDGMSLFHIGWQRGFDRCFGHGKRSQNLLGGAIVVLRLGLWVFTATISQWTTAPESLAVLGLVVVIGQLMLLKLGSVFLKDKELAEHKYIHQHNVQVDDSSEEQSGEFVVEEEEVHHPFEEQRRRSVIRSSSRSAAAWPNVTSPQAEATQPPSLRGAFYNRSPHSSHYHLNGVNGDEQ